MRRKTRQIIGRIHDAYGDALKYIARLMKENGIQHIELKFKEHNIPPVFNIGDWNGDAFSIVRLKLDTENGRSLIAYDQEGNEFAIGLELQDQDNYTLVGLQNLVSASEKAIDEVLGRCILLPQGIERETLIKAIRSHIGSESNISFDNGFPYPVFQESCIDREVITAASSKEITTLNAGNKVRHILLENMTRKELLALATGINEYIKYIHNNA